MREGEVGVDCLCRGSSQQLRDLGAGGRRWGLQVEEGGQGWESSARGESGVLASVICSPVQGSGVIGR